MSDTIVIGGSAAGLASAFAMAQLGHHVMILERDPQPGDEEPESHEYLAVDRLSNTDRLGN
jgi:2-polyprenyl-6-methoxyphenol hydroxylase-like FAD-dependent oxidoreductase